MPSVKKARDRIGHEEMQRVVRVDRHEHLWIGGDLNRPEQADRDEPDGHDRTEQRANGPGAVTLDREQRDDEIASVNGSTRP